ncbi:hypothetical protein MGH68_10825 [Erysipelothrix sp. D19-032]
MDINKAIIHTLDDDLKSIILSQQPPNLNNRHAIENYLLKLVKGMQNKDFNDTGNNWRSQSL